MEGSPLTKLNQHESFVKQSSGTSVGCGMSKTGTAGGHEEAQKHCAGKPVACAKVATTLHTMDRN